MLFFVNLLADLQSTKHHPAFHHFRYLFSNHFMFCLKLRAYIPPPVDIHRVALSSKRLPMPSEVGKHQLQPKMISSETWRRFSKLFRVSPPGVPKSKSSIRKILRVNAEVERMCSAVQGALPYLRNCKPHREATSTISESVMRSSWCLVTHHAVVSLLHWQQSYQTKRSAGPKNDLGLNLSYLLSSSWEKQRLCHNVDTFCDDCWSSSATRAAPRLWSGWICLKQRYAIFSIRPVKSIKRDE